MKKPSLPFIVIWAIIILGVAIVAIPLHRGNQANKLRIKASKIELRNFDLALNKYKLDNLAYPTTEQGLKALLEKPTMPPIPQDWKTPYISDDINDCWENPYQYCCPSQHNRPDFDIWSFGPDGKDGTEDDITNWSDNKPVQAEGNSTMFYSVIVIIIMLGVAIILSIKYQPEWWPDW